MKVGILGGSFDPIHLGHLNLAISLAEAADLEKVVFVPTSLSPFKEITPPVASADHRMQMLKRALHSIPFFEILDWEIKSQGPTYTIDTVRRLAKDSSSELHLLIGEDHLPLFHRWKEVEELIRLAPPLIGAREAELTQVSTEWQKKLHKHRVEIPLFDISSTQIRKRLAEKKYCGHLLAASVESYIMESKLYF